MSDNDQMAVKTDTPVLTATPVAVEKIKGLLAEKELPDHGLRVFVAGAGCSGLQYGMMLEGNPRDSDTIVKIDGIKLIIDRQSLSYLNSIERTGPQPLNFVHPRLILVEPTPCP